MNQPPGPFTVAQLIDRLRGYRLPVSSELRFQEGVAEVLTRLGEPYQPERQLFSAAGVRLGRIDFYLPIRRVGLELKVKGSPSDVTRQLLRYTQSPAIDELALVTWRRELGRLPTTLGGKPLHVVACWKGGL
jgi:hypothetical protein